MDEPVANKFKQDFWEYLQAHMDEEIAAIVRCQKLDQTVVDSACAGGLEVDRELQLIKSLAVRGTGAALIHVARQPWALHIESDQAVHTSE